MQVFSCCESSGKYIIYEYGNVVYLKDIDAADIDVGDEICFYFYYESGSCDHTIQHVSDIVPCGDGKIYFITKYDSMSKPGRYVRPEDIIGVYKHKGGFLGSLVTTLYRKPLYKTYDWNMDLIGDGTKENPYLISNIYDFQKYAFYINEKGSSLYGMITSLFRFDPEYEYFGNPEDNAELFQMQSDNGYLEYKDQETKTYMEYIISEYIKWK